VIKIKGKDRWNYFRPSEPTNLSGSSGDSQVVLTWTASSSISQIPVTDYIVQYTSDDGVSWNTFNDRAINSTSLTITGLSNGTGYKFRVAGVNDVGQSLWSAVTDNIVPSVVFSVTYLLVAGGGGGGTGRGAGGGAGGVLTGSGNISANQSLSVAIGSGGGPGESGSNTTFPLIDGTVSAFGGGRGADGLIGLFTGMAMDGTFGGSGGGGSGYNPTGSGGAGTTGQGYSGGAGYGGGEPYGGGGGGGAGGVGDSGQISNGGSGITNSLLAPTDSGIDSDGIRYIAGGGGGGSYQATPGSGGSGGGGAGGNTNVAGFNGVDNSGGGGGGGGNSAAGGSGGSGLAIIRVGDSVIASSTTGSPSVYVVGGYRYYKFTQSGTITF
jgi:hypothetical protein